MDSSDIIELLRIGLQDEHGLSLHMVDILLSALHNLHPESAQLVRNYIRVQDDRAYVKDDEVFNILANS